MPIKSEWKLFKSINGLIKKKGLPSPSCLIQSIGDDCAVFQISKSRSGLITTDISIESVHFRLDYSSLSDIGFKAMMGNVSDICAMGGKPELAFISIGIPEKLIEKDVLSIYDGLIEACNMAGVNIAGGDTSKSEKIIISITLYGEALTSKVICRNKAKTGDTIYVTGDLGRSMAGLEILSSSDKNAAKRFKSLVQKHKRPVARFAAVSEISKKFNPTSMIDISDGLLSDLRHICESSKRGFILDEEKLPVSDELKNYATEHGKSYIEYAKSSGEEYELLFTSDRKFDLPVKINNSDIIVTPIGTITDKDYFVLSNNKKIKISITGFDHFKSKG